MGFGHRVYKNFDPRSKVMKQVAIDILKESKTPDSTLRLAMELEKAALADDYFVKRKLYPNVDFYTGIVYRAIGIPLDMFTVMFAVGRTSGWVCQWREMMLENQRKIGRPRQLYVGELEKKFVPIEERRSLPVTQLKPLNKSSQLFPNFRPSSNFQFYKFSYVWSS